MDDDLYPNEGGYYLPQEPVEQAISRKKERAKTLEGKAILKTVVERLEEQIAKYDSVSAIPKEVKVDPQKFLIAVNANQIARDVLIGEKEYIEQLLDSSGVTDI